MAFHTCLFVVAATSDDELALLRSRVEVLRRYFAAYAPATAHVREIAPPGVLAGCIALGVPWERDGDYVWGRPDIGPGAAVEVLPDGARFTTGPVDIAAGYRAGRAVSTHAVAAAFLDRGEVRLRPEVLADLLAFGHPANDAHLVAGVDALPAGAEVVVDARGMRTKAPAPAWRLPDERSAHEAAVAALTACLERWHAHGSLALGLSAGMDSRVVAVCLRENGLPFETYTWGSPGSPEVEGAAAVAAQLGVPHAVVPPEPLADGQVVEQARRDIVWTEGCAAIGLAAGGAALSSAVNVTGAGGELGRAFHYALIARNRADPGPSHLRRAWEPHRNLDPTIAAAARDRVRDEATAAIARAEAAGVDGWRVLDVVYAEQRMRRWTRSRIPPTAGAALTPAFLDPDVAAALVALPLEDRLTAAFHRGFVQARAPALALPAPPGQRRHVPAAARRLASAWRSRRPRRAASDAPSLEGHPLTRRFLHDSVPDAASVREGLGAPFADALRRGIAQADPRALEIAMTLAGATLAADVVAALRDDAASRIGSPPPGTHHL